MADGPRAERTPWSGRVVDAGGRAVAGAHVVIVSGSVAMPEIAMVTDDDGRFALGLPAGTFTLGAYTPGGSGEADVDSRPPPGERAAGSEIVIVVAG